MLDYRRKLLILTGLEFVICMCILLLPVRVFWLLYIFYLVGSEIGASFYVVPIFTIVI